MVLKQEKYHVMRTDGTGNRFFVSCWHSQAGANAERIRLESGGHKQDYNVEPTSSCNHEILQTTTPP